MRRKLGTYVVCVAVLQLALYVLAGWYGEDGQVLFYWDPRIGWFMFETMLRGAVTFPGALSWLSAAVLLGVGVGLVLDRFQMRTYLWTEGVMTIPTLLAFLVIIIANADPGQGSSVRELLVPVLVLLFASIAPWCVGWMFVDQAG